MNKYYILVELNSEYNDEGYDMQECGDPIKVFTSMKEAEQAKTLAEFKKSKECNLLDYQVDGRAIERGFIAKYNEIFGTDLVELDYNFKLPEKTTMEQYLQLEPFINLNFFKIVECE